MGLRYPLIDVDSVTVADGGQRLLTDIPEIESALAYHLTIPPGSSRGRQTNRNADEALICLQERMNGKLIRAFMSIAGNKAGIP